MLVICSNTCIFTYHKRTFKMGSLGAGEIIIILFIVILLFGGKKIPELAKGLAQGIRSFKKGLNDETPKDPEQK